MKNVLALPLLSILLIFNSLSAQIILQPVEKIYEVYEVVKAPSFPGGEAEMFKFISKSLSQPQGLHQDSILGTKLVLAFVVDTSGLLTQLKVEKDVGGQFGAAALQMLQTMPPWIPGEVEGRKVSTRYRLPITIEFK